MYLLLSVHRAQLLLQVVCVKCFHHQPQQQQQKNSGNSQEELTPSEIDRISDYFSHRVASEPYDSSCIASFITLLTLPIYVLREFLKLNAWKKGISLSQVVDVAPSQKPCIELCLENHAGLEVDGSCGNLSAIKSNIHYDWPHNSVDFSLTIVLDPAYTLTLLVAVLVAILHFCKAEILIWGEF
ncbi:hypothetical protein Nepgr_015038 [Nepenthes gracilis]|uniref:Uncharacterized protein n=1 Tax=Nepenthes gracilis TaxID=150966 RepID=A0AAD3XQ29_NEPGR|nr:hypothetical protein Nepgr_015038 [Nepenthes gracilis]